jgi:hypothetical protein
MYLGRKKYRHHGRASLCNMQTAGTQHSGSCGWRGQLDRVFDRITWSWDTCIDSHVCFITERILRTIFCTMATVQEYEEELICFPALPQVRRSAQITYAISKKLPMSNHHQILSRHFHQLHIAAVFTSGKTKPGVGLNWYEAEYVPEIFWAQWVMDSVIKTWKSYYVLCQKY